MIISIQEEAGNAILQGEPITVFAVCVAEMCSYISGEMHFRLDVQV